MSSSQKMTIIPKVEKAVKVPKKHKNKKKKEKKNKSKTKFVPNFLLHDDYSEMAFMQMQQAKKRKKAKKKTKPSEDFQQPKLKKQLKDKHQIPIIYISSDQETQQSVENCQRSIKGKIKKRVIFNLPPEYSQDTKTNHQELTKKLFVGESSLESNTPEEMNSQDLFITQKSFLDPYVDIFSSSSGSEGASMKMPENHLYKLTTEATTQTENFFTFPAISTSFRIQQQQIESMCEEEPMDLSLPTRTRGSKQPSKLKLSDTSSEEGEMPSKPKGDLLQLKVIQTRLNESFFFKMKGEDSPKPVSPLMKLTQSVEKKTKK